MPDISCSRLPRRSGTESSQFLPLFGVWRGLGQRAAAGFDVDGVERLAAGHEEAVALRAAEGDVRDDLRHLDVADARAVGVEDVHAVVALADPAHAGPDIAVLVAADAVGEAALAVVLAGGEHPRVLEAPAVDVVDPDAALRVG